MKRFYRSFIDSLEEASTACADVIVVNSAFTAQTFASAFPSIATHAPPPEVLYPVVDFEERTEERSAIAYTKGVCVCVRVFGCVLLDYDLTFVLINVIISLSDLLCRGDYDDLNSSSS